MTGRRRSKQSERMAELGRRGGAALAAKRRLKRDGPAPFAGTMLDMMDLAGMTGPSWEPWRSFWRAVYGLPMNPGDIARLQLHAGRSEAPDAPVREAWLVIGRRGGKSRNVALAALFQAIRANYTALLAPGERALVLVLAADKYQARSTLSYVKGLAKLPAFAPYVVRVLKDHIELTTGCDIRVATASYRTTRGYSLAAVIAEEIAFWLSDESGANPDTEIIRAVRPALATVPGSLLIGLSSPYAARGELYKAFTRFHGRDDPAGLCWCADSRSMNAGIDPQIIADAYEADPLAAASEYGRDGAVAFRRDVEGFLDVEAVQAVTVPGRRELPALRGVRHLAFVDPSGGSVDAFTLAIAHAVENRAVLDLVRERRPPFSPDAVVAEFAEVLKLYGVTVVTGDRYAGEFSRELFAKHGIVYTPSARVRSDIYREFLPLVNAGRVELLQLPRLAAQLVGLERRVARGGKDQINHAPGGHDDVANAAAGALVLAAEGAAGNEDVIEWAGGALEDGLPRGRLWDPAGPPVAGPSLLL